MKGYLLINRQNGKGYVVTDSSDVGRILSVDRVTIWRLFKASQVVEYKEWIIVKGYDVIKSSRGKRNFF
jgi:hypothetical protein